METSADRLAPYNERDGVNAAAEAEEIIKDPERQLTKEELEEASSFAKVLFEGKVENGPKCEAGVDLERVYKMNALQSYQEFYLGYFDTTEGQQDLVDLGIKDTSAWRIAAQLQKIDTIKAKLNAEQRKEIAGRSREWYIDMMAQRLEAHPVQDSVHEDVEPIGVNYDPSKIISKLSKLRAYRDYYKAIRQNLKQLPESDLTDAKGLLLDLYAAKTNAMIAELYPGAMDLIRQLETMPDNQQTQEWLSEIKAISPTMEKALLREKARAATDFNDEFARRLDLFKNGAGEMQKGQLIPISDTVNMLAIELESSLKKEPEASVPAEVAEKLKSMEWRAQDVKGFAELILGEWGLLSKEKADWDEIEERERPALDNKWQIAVHPSKKSFTIDARKRVFWIPAGYNSLEREHAELGPLPLIAHELTHILQRHFDYELGNSIPLARLNGRGTSALREGGAIAQERKVKETFGYERPTNLFYLRALSAKLAGSNKTQIARAFYETNTKGKTLNEAQLAESRRRAVDGTLRLFRHGGHDSQPMAYIEQDLIWRQLAAEGEDKAEIITIAGGSFSLKDTARLRQFGLLQIPGKLDVHPAEQVIDIFIKKYLTAPAT
ncbi:MAG: hypothetical protein JWO96_17 [Candidatus Saccharibacteria bacterium]|nr:hypothetical protein [Candidatus Saccharibacteria bacterium]